MQTGRKIRTSRERWKEKEREKRERERERDRQPPGSASGTGAVLAEHGGDASEHKDEAARSPDRRAS